MNRVRLPVCDLPGFLILFHFNPFWKSQQGDLRGSRKRRQQVLSWLDTVVCSSEQLLAYYIKLWETLNAHLSLWVGLTVISWNVLECLAALASSTTLRSCSKPFSTHKLLCFRISIVRLFLLALRTFFHFNLSLIKIAIHSVQLISYRSLEKIKPIQWTLRKVRLRVSPCNWWGIELKFFFKNKT